MEHQVLFLAVLASTKKRKGRFAMQTRQQEKPQTTTATVENTVKRPVIIAMPETDLDDIFGAGRCPPKM